MAQKNQKGFVPVSKEENALHDTIGMAEDVKPEPAQKKTMQYIGPKYKGRIVLPHFTRPSDPRKWNETTILTYLWKWPDLSRYFGYK